MYPDDYMGAYEIIEESNGCAKIRSKIKAERCRHCDQDSIQSNGTVKKTVYDIDSRTGNIITIQVAHYRYRCNNPNCAESSFTLDVLPHKCFPNEETSGRSNKSKSRDVLNAAMDYFLFGTDDNGNPVSEIEAANKYGFDRKVISTELHTRVNATLDRHILSNEICAQAALVPFKFKDIMRCAVMGYIDDNGRLKPVLYDIRDVYSHEDLLQYLNTYSYSAMQSPEIVYTDIDNDLIESVCELYIEKYNNYITVGAVKSAVKDFIMKFSAGTLEDDIVLKEYLAFSQRQLVANLYDKVICGFGDDTEDNVEDADFAARGVDFFKILEKWLSEVEDEAVKKSLQPLYDTLAEDFGIYIDESMTRYREDGVCPECDLKFIDYFRNHNWGFEEMRYRVHCLSKNRQNVSFQQLISGKYTPVFSGTQIPTKTITHYYIDLNELNRIFSE